MSTSFLSLRQSCQSIWPLRGRVKAKHFQSRQYHVGRKYEPVWLEDVEPGEQYRSGSLHPVKLTDEFCNGRYRVTHKLGHGSGCTVWLARDRLVNKNVSLKIQTAWLSERSSETGMLAKIHQNATHHAGCTFVQPLLDEFRIHGPNGEHQCLVSDALGPNLKFVKDSSNTRLPISIAKRVTGQLALGLAAIHSCGIVHGGKLYTFASSLDQLF